MRKNIEDIFKQEDADEVICDLFEWVFDYKDESRWTETEREAVVFSDFMRWGLNGGVKGYLLMPASTNVQEVIDLIQKLDLETFSTRLLQTVEIFRGCKMADANARQSYPLSQSELDYIDETDDLYFELEDELYRRATVFFQNRKREFVE